MHYLLIVLCFADRSSFNKFAKVVSLCKSVYEANTFGSLTISFKFVKIEKITRISVVRDAAIQI